MGFANERTVRAVRKARQCCACGLQIETGSPAVDWSGTSDGDFHAVSYHVECRAAEIALNKLNDTQWDEWTGLDDMEWEDWQFILDDHPVVAARLKITQARIDKVEREQAACRAAWAEVARKRDAEPERQRHKLCGAVIGRSRGRERYELDRRVCAAVGDRYRRQLDHERNRLPAIRRF